MFLNHITVSVIRKILSLDLGGGRHPDPVCVTENNVLLKTLILFLPQDLLFLANVSQFRNCAYAETAIFLEI